MQRTVYIRLSDQAPRQAQWLNSQQEGGELRSGELREAALRHQGDRCTVLLPAGSLLPLFATLPPLQGKRLRQALPYAVEEQLAEEVESYHLALGRRQEDGRQTLLAISRERMQALQEQFAEAELRPHRLIDEAQCLPWQPGEWTLLLESHDALLRLSAHEAYSLPLKGLEGLLELALQGGQEVTLLRIYDARGEEAAAPVWGGALRELEQHYQVIDEPLKLFSGADDEATINLLQGEFSRKEQLGRLWRPWRASAALLAAWLLLLLGQALFDYRNLAAEEQRLYAAVEQVYRNTFPEAKNVVNPRVQMERQLQQLQGGGGGGAFVKLLATSGPVISKSGGTNLQTLRYRQGELELELEVADLPALDSLKEQLQQAGVVVEIRNATSGESRVEARLAIREGGA